MECPRSHAMSQDWTGTRLDGRTFPGARFPRGPVYLGIEFGAAPTGGRMPAHIRIWTRPSVARVNDSGCAPAFNPAFNPFRAPSRLRGSNPNNGETNAAQEALRRRLGGARGRRRAGGPARNSKHLGRPAVGGGHHL